MGSGSSTVDEKNRARKLLGDEILQIIISELQNTIKNSNAKTGPEIVANEKKTKEIITLQEKFTEYRKLAEEAIDQSIEQMRSDKLQLQSSLEEYKQKFDKSSKEKLDLEQTFYNQEITLGELNGKYNKLERNLSTECELRKSLEKDMMQMKTLKREFGTQATKVQELERELNNTKIKLLAETKLKQELETQLKWGENISKHGTTKVLRDTIDKQSVIIKELQQKLLESDLRTETNMLMSKLRTVEAAAEKQRFQTQLKFEEQQKQLQKVTDKLSLAHSLEHCLEIEKQYLLKTLRTVEAETEKERSKNRLTFEEQGNQLKEITEKLRAAQKFENLEIEKQLSTNLRNEKEYLMNELQTLKTEFEEERSKSKLKYEEQETQLKEVTRKLSAAQKTNKQQVKLKNKAQAELFVLEKENSKIKQLEAKLEEKDRILSKNLNDTQQKTQENINELQMEIELSNFLKMREEGLVKELQMKDLEQDDLKLKHEAHLQEQLKKFNRIVYKLKMTEKKRDQQEQLRKEVEGKLNLLEDSYRSIKGFYEKELRERKDFLKEFENVKQQTKECSEPKATTSKESDFFIIEKLALETQLDSKTNEIALLKQQLKFKETEIQRMACKEHSNNKRSEMATLHEEFMENLQKFNRNQED